MDDLESISDRELIGLILEISDPFRKNRNYFSNTNYRLGSDYTDLEDFDD